MDEEGIGAKFQLFTLVILRRCQLSGTSGKYETPTGVVLRSIMCPRDLCRAIVIYLDVFPYPSSLHRSSSCECSEAVLGHEGLDYSK